ncbi:MAG: hypothetical protein ACYS76_16785 [Planctomycetota bacterium]
MKFEWLKVVNDTYVANLPTGVLFQVIESDSSTSTSTTFVPGIFAVRASDGSVEFEEIERCRT